MTRILFVCHGNICRSPMAEYVFRDLVLKAGVADRFEVDSCAVSREEIGNDVYPPAKRVLLAHGIPCPKRGAKELTAADAEASDLILCMDQNNLYRLTWYAVDPSKVSLLGEYGLGGKEIEDPWYTDRYDKVYREIETCCKALLRELREKE